MNPVTKFIKNYKYRMNSKVSILFLLIFTIPLFSQESIKVISSDRSSVVVEYTPSYSDTSSRIIDNSKYLNIELRDGFIPHPEKWGEPAVPEKIVNIGVPSEFGNTIQVINSFYKEVHGNLIPKPALNKKDNVAVPVYKLGNNYSTFKSKSDLVTFGDYGISRGVKTQSLILSPVKFDASNRVIRLYTKIIFKVNFSQNQKISTKPAGNFLKGALLNYNAAKYWNNFKSTQKKLIKTVKSSVLASGKWVRFETPSEGIYKITRSMLASFGIDANTVDPRTIKIYNNGGTMLPEEPMASRPNDLVQNAIIVVGENDGKFDDGDYILFYGRGNDFWSYDTASKSIKRNFNLYSKVNYYWITSGGAKGKRIAGQPSLNQKNAYVQTSSKAFADWEEDKINIGKTGRRFLGDDFTPNVPSRTYTTKLDGRIASQPINYQLRYINGSQNYIGLSVSENAKEIFSRNLYGWGSEDFQVGKAFLVNFSYSGDLPENRSVLKLTMTPTTVASTGYIDYFNIYYQRSLNAVNDNLVFYSKDTSSVIQYSLSGFSSSQIQVFNVSDYANVKVISNPIMLSGGEFRFQANEKEGQVSKYIALAGDNFLTPKNPVEISNSDLHGIQQGAKFIIITTKDFQDAANRLKTYRETQAKVKISTIVVDVDPIFNEFGCGLHDVSAIRDFIKYAYDNWNIKPQYVLLLGKGTYDYKDIEGMHNNFLPAYETMQSVDLVTSYSTDDFFVRVDGNDNLVDLAIGRLTVENSTEANDAVDKIIHYEQDSDKGAWRNLITLLADDGYTSKTYEGSEHTAPSEYLANYIIPSSYNLKKIYMAAYPVVITGMGRRMPEVNKAIIDAMNEGTLIFNYVGHGSPELWAHEVVFENSTTIPQLHNSRYFFLTAATCDFGYFDIPNTVSGAEELVLKKDAGAIGAFTASRLVYSNLNHELMYQLFRELLLTPRDTLNLSIPIGRANFLTKQVYYGENDQKYNILGDPTLRLLIPEYNASIDSIDGKRLNTTVNLKALSKTRIEGEVKTSNNKLWSDFNGDGILTVYDSQRQVKLASIGNYPMTVQGGVLFRGRVSIENGKFATNFVVPKDISYENKKGKVILYFYNSDVDGVGSTDSVIVGGTDSSTVNDGKGPNMEISFDNPSFSDAYLVNPNSTLIVKLSDQTGLNTTGTGVGHKLEGILNGKENDPIDFTNYFTGDLDAGGKSGEIKYPLNGMAPGKYKIQIKAWDVFNNFSTKSADFKVVSGNELEISDVYNYPNPFYSNTTFTFQQNLDSPLDVKIKIYTIAGRFIKKIEKYNVLDRFVKINWNGLDEDGDAIANGTYLYKIIVHSTDGKYTKSVLGKLAVIK